MVAVVVNEVYRSGSGPTAIGGQGRPLVEFFVMQGRPGARFEEQ